MIMSAFKALRDVSNRFEEDLRQVSSELFTAKINEPFEDVVGNKLKDLSLYTSKLRFLQAKTQASLTAQTDKQTTLENYADTVRWKLVEQQVLKSVTQAHAVKALICTPDTTLTPEMLERKVKILEQLTIFEDKEVQLRHLDAVVQERRQHLENMRREWDTQLGLLREMGADVSEISQPDQNNALSTKLHQLERKVSLLRALMAALASARGGSYDWMADPQRRLRALQLARN